MLIVYMLSHVSQHPSSTSTKSQMLNQNSLMLLCYSPSSFVIQDIENQMQVRIILACSFQRIDDDIYHLQTNVNANPQPYGSKEQKIYITKPNIYMRFGNSNSQLNSFKSQIDITKPDIYTCLIEGIIFNHWYNFFASTTIAIIFVKLYSSFKFLVLKSTFNMD